MKKFEQLMKWISERKRFVFYSPGYIVVGMSRDEYDRSVKKTAAYNFNYELFSDELIDEFTPGKE